MLRRVFLACFLVLAAACPALAEADAAAESGALAISASGTPADLVVANRHVVTLRATVSAITPLVRVEGVQGRIRELKVSDLTHPVVSKRVLFGGQQAYAIEINGRHLLGILAEDADVASGERIEALAEHAVAALNVAREAYLELNRADLIIRNVAAILAATFLLVLLFYLLVRLHGHVRTRLAELTGRRMARINARGLDLTTFAIRSGRRAVAAVHYATIAFCTYLWLAFVLGVFAYSRPWAERLAGWLIDLLLKFIDGMAGAMPGLFTVAVIFLIARMAARGLHALLGRVEREELALPGVYPETVPATRSISTVLIWLFALTVAYPYFPGSDSDVFKGVSLFAGLMVTLGSSGIAAQWMNGIMLVYSRAFRPGDMVMIGTHEGVVTAHGLLFTKIRTATGAQITLPNSAVTGGSIQNFTRLNPGEGIRVSSTVTIGYDAPWRQVHAMLLEAARRTPDLRANPQPFVLQRSLNDFYVEYELVGRIDVPLDRPFVMTTLHAHVQDVFNEYGVQIMSPHFVAQPERPVGVERRRWFSAPAKSDAVPASASPEEPKDRP